MLRNTSCFNFVYICNIILSDRSYALCAQSDWTLSPTESSSDFDWIKIEIQTWSGQTLSPVGQYSDLRSKFDPLVAANDMAKLRSEFDPLAIASNAVTDSYDSIEFQS